MSLTSVGITASMPGGSFVGALASGFLSDKFGRKTSIQIGSVIWCIGSILVCASQVCLKNRCIATRTHKLRTSVCSLPDDSSMVSRLESALLKFQVRANDF